MNRPGRIRINKPVWIAHGDSIEFLLVEIFDRLEAICQAVTVAWNDPRRFEKLEECLDGKALAIFKRLVSDRYLNPVDRTDANYKELRMLMPADLADHAYSRNKIRQYADQKLKYTNFCREDGRREEPTDVLRPMQELRELSSRCQHSFGPDGIFMDDEFKQVYWDIFPNTMQDCS